MFDMSWGEMMVIGAVALIVIGPKDLPKALRTVGNMVGKVRRMAGEFQGQFQEAMREAELDEVRKNVEGLNRSVSSFNPINTIRDEITGTVKAPEASTSPAAIAAATDNAAFTGTEVATPKHASIVETPPLPDIEVPLPEPAPVVDLSRDVPPSPAVEALPALPDNDAEPRRAKA